MGITPTEHHLQLYITLTDDITLEPLSNESISITYQTISEDALGRQPSPTTVTRITNSDGVIADIISYYGDFDTSYGVEVNYSGDEIHNSATSKLTYNSSGFHDDGTPIKFD